MEELQAAAGVPATMMLVVGGGVDEPAVNRSKA
jgi:sugar (pentulose or hexulose) kinase